MNKPVNVWSEFQPLKRVVLGAPFPPETFQWHKDEETRTCHGTDIQRNC